MAVEYYIQTIPLPIDNEDVLYHLNKLGSDRWRLLFVTITNDARLWFMREVEVDLEINPLEVNPNGQ